ncbi:MAG: hypothetical protein M1516_02195 [Firmicutes bacterium]|jgi:Cu/Ag efflux protein CusF|nr:hypothetical protein [Bacillota bacterium]
MKLKQVLRRGLLMAEVVLLAGGIAACGSATPTAAASATSPVSHHHSSPHKKRRRLHGKITKLTSSTLTITTKHGSVYTLQFGSTTRVRSGRTTTSASALKAGEVVTVLEKRGGTPLQAAVIRIRPGT